LRIDQDDYDEAVGAAETSLACRHAAGPAIIVLDQGQLEHYACNATLQVVRETCNMPNVKNTAVPVLNIFLFCAHTVHGQQEKTKWYAMN
jgi:hypothetical protein